MKSREGRRTQETMIGRGGEEIGNEGEKRKEKG